MATSAVSECLRRANRDVQTLNASSKWRDEVYPVAAGDAHRGAI